MHQRGYLPTWNNELMTSGVGGESLEMIRVAFIGPGTSRSKDIFGCTTCVTKHSKVRLVMTMYCTFGVLGIIAPSPACRSQSGGGGAASADQSSGHNYDWKTVLRCSVYVYILEIREGRTYDPHGIVNDLFRPRPSSLTYYFFMITISSSFEA
jgi:hypothetical protein